MTPFNLEAAQRGKEIITRSRKPARYIAMLQKTNADFPLLVEVQVSNTKIKDCAGHSVEAGWQSENYAVTGMHTPPHESPLDLFIKELGD